MAAWESSSNMTPVPAPTPGTPATSTASIRMVGITISFAGIAMMYATRMIPDRPSAKPNGSRAPIRPSASDASPARMLLSSQITAPAGAANTTARQSTISVRSMIEV